MVMQDVSIRGNVVRDMQELYYLGNSSLNLKLLQNRKLEKNARHPLRYSRKAQILCDIGDRVPCWQNEFRRSKG